MLEKIILLILSGTTALFLTAAIKRHFFDWNSWQWNFYSIENYFLLLLLTIVFTFLIFWALRCLYRRLFCTYKIYYYIGSVKDKGCSTIYVDNTIGEVHTSTPIHDYCIYVNYCEDETMCKNREISISETMYSEIVVGNTVKVVRTDYISRLTKTVLDTNYFAETLTE